MKPIYVFFIGFVLFPLSYAMPMDCYDHMNKGFKLHQSSASELSGNNSALLTTIEGHYQTAIDMCPNLCEKYPELCDNFGLVSQNLGKLKIAEFYFKQSILSKPNMESAFLHLAELYEKQKLFALALHNYLKIIEINKDHVKAAEHAKNIFMNQDCLGVAVEDQHVLSPDSMYNVVACASIFDRYKKRFNITRSIVVAPVAFRNILFELGSDQLQPKSSQQLDNILTMMNEHNDLKLVISGHTDDTPVNRNLPMHDNEYCRSNQCLSEYRALSVKNYLIEHGVSNKRLKTQGYADTMPYDPNNKPLNRRVEILDMDYCSE